jgi:hypothetical protein
MTAGAYTDSFSGSQASTLILIAGTTTFTTVTSPYTSEGIVSAGLGSALLPPSFIPSCMIDQAVASTYPILQNYYLEDNMVSILIPVLPAPQCTAPGVICSNRVRLDPLLTGADITFTYAEAL